MSRSEVEARRRELEQRVGELRGDLEDTLGWAPRAAWTLPLVGIAVGFSAALWFGKKRRGRRQGAQELPPRRR